MTMAYRAWNIDTKKPTALARVKFTRALQDELVVASVENRKSLADALVCENERKMGFGVAPADIKMNKPREMCPD